MKVSMSVNLVGSVLSGLIKKDVQNRQTRREILKEYRAVMSRASDIGSSNRLLSSYLLAAFFIAMNRQDGLSADENIEILETNMRKSRALKAFMGDAKGYFSEKSMASRRKWSAETHDPAHRQQFPNDWVVDVLEKTEHYQFGFDYLECGVCKLCRDEKCPELAKYLCSLDYMLVEIMGLHLNRTMVLAEGAPKCDFRFLK